MPENKNKLLCAETIKGLISYAEQRIRNQSSGLEVGEIRKLVENMEGYWGLEKDWVKQFDENIQKAEAGRIPGHLSEKQKVEVISGLHRYAMEMEEAQGFDAAEEIERVQTFIQRLGNEWNLSDAPIKEICCTIKEAQENMCNQPKMGMDM